ncbi:monovalent cation/H+ antiporter subunit G [Anaplasma phagocytophilum str. MRK]|nr:monovalent cation/H+ antiporter subunit G [Anaplasma phagocytophilum str. MRK]
MIGMGVMGLGIVFVVVAVVGVIRLPDFYSRVHAASILDSLGAILICLGLAMQYGFSVFTLKTLVLICLLLITNTTICGILTGAACKSKENDGSDSLDVF